MWKLVSKSLMNPTAHFTFLDFNKFDHCGYLMLMLCLQVVSWKLAQWYVSNVSIIFDASCLFYTICLVFHYTLWHFYAISGTNLLTRCHSASSLFFAIFVFQKSNTGNILGIGRNKFENSYFSRTKDEDQTGAREGPEAAHTTRGRDPAPGRAHPLWGAPGPPLTTPLRL
jgi:hypothetical protein